MIARARAALVALAVLGTLVLAGCSANGSSLTIFGAASLGGALDKVRTAYEAAVPGAVLTISTDSSAALEAQIEQGAPADVFLSADTAQPHKLIDGGFATGDAVVFACNRLALIVPAANPGRITSPADLARSGLKIVAAGDAVPVSRYAAQLVANLATEPGYPPDFAAAYEANVVSKEDNVRALVAKVELGEGDAGIVYLTDAAASVNVRTIDLPGDANVPASYAGVVVANASGTDAAAAFLAWLAGPDGQAILASFGFLPADA